MRDATLADLSALRALFATANDAPYDLASVVEEKCFEAGYLGPAQTRVIELDGRIIGASVTCGKFLRVLAVDRNARRREFGSELLRDAEERGASIIAAEPGNYFTPGVSAFDERSISFFKAKGYVETARTANLETRLTDLPQATAVRRANQNDKARVLQFVERDFGRIWRFETGRAFELDEPRVFVAEDGAEIVGFAAFDTNNRGLGSFGPTGVAKSMRGRGVGCSLLLASLAAMRETGYERATIAWTDAFDFYRRCCGAEPAHRFIAFARPQP
jgi:N-acetylglutamate synthase-like GNAT family acetyltransferase